ncbi:MAG TPA: SLBB domain-containing protein [bacterium]|nr:SLBB domain-containing protein [bacterium]
MRARGLTLTGWFLVTVLSQLLSGEEIFPGHPNLEVFGQRFFSEYARITRPAEMPVSDQYVLGPSDSLVVHIWGFVEETHELVLDADGGIFIPRVGRLLLGGKSLKEARHLIEEHLYAKYKGIKVSVTAGKVRTMPVYVLGEVRKPGTYEISPQFDLLDVLALSGGPNQRGSLRHIRVSRKEEAGFTVDLYPFLLEGKRPQAIEFRQGDTIFVPLAEVLVGLEGAVRRPGIYELKEEKKLSEVIALAGGFLPTADRSWLQVERQDPVRGIVMIDLTPETFPAFEVSNFDVVKVASLPREKFYQVEVEGMVKRPGTFGWKEGLRLAEVLSRAEILPEALMERAEIIRQRSDGSYAVVPFSPEKLLAGEEAQNLLLQPRDRIVISSRTRPEKRIIIQGQVCSPGEYTVASGERLSSVLARAGGFTPDAYLPGAVFLRESVRVQREQFLRRFIQEKTKQLEKEEARAQGAEEKTLIERGKTLLKQLSESEVRGRVVIHLAPLEQFRNSPSDFYLEDGDMLYIPKKPVSVAVIGEVSQTTNIIYEEKMTLNDYIARAGDYTRDADRGNIFIVRADGTATRKLDRILPGDTIIVPFQARERLGKVVRDIVQMIYQISLSISTF